VETTIRGDNRCWFGETSVLLNVDSPPPQTGVGGFSNAALNRFARS
jgi:hypothetical protein